MIHFYYLIIFPKNKKSDSSQGVNPNIFDISEEKNKDVIHEIESKIIFCFF
jgi:hypothetical protein